jgi:hypothetical protein
MGAMPDTMQPAPLPSVYQLRVVVRGVSPLVWRRLLIPADTTIAGLHAVLQIAFGWTGTHLHRFVVQGREYGIGYVGGPSFGDDPRRVRLGDLGLRPTERFTYHYDFTAGWCHDLRVEQILVAEPGRNGPQVMATLRNLAITLHRLAGATYISDVAASADGVGEFDEPAVLLGDHERGEPAAAPGLEGVAGRRRRRQSVLPVVGQSSR